MARKESLRKHRSADADKSIAPAEARQITEELAIIWAEPSGPVLPFPKPKVDSGGDGMTEEQAREFLAGVGAKIGDREHRFRKAPGSRSRSEHSLRRVLLRQARIDAGRRHNEAKHKD